MLPHPEIARILTAQRVAAAAGAAARRQPRLRTRLGLVLVALGTKLAADALVARRPQRDAQMIDATISRVRLHDLSALGRSRPACPGAAGPR